MYQDMYEGNGKENPPVITRLDRLETAAADLKAIKVAVIGMILVVIGDIISQHIK